MACIRPSVHRAHVFRTCRGRASARISLTRLARYKQRRHLSRPGRDVAILLFPPALHFGGARLNPLVTIAVWKKRPTRKTHPGSTIHGTHAQARTPAMGATRMAAWQRSPPRSGNGELPFLRASNG